MGLAKKVGAAIGVVVVLVAVGWLLGVFGLPSFGIVDVGDWGEVTDSTTEVRTELWVKNPNPVGVVVPGSVGVEYGIDLNGVRLGEGERRGIAIRQGNQTKTVTTELDNSKLPEWWVSFVRADETVRTDVEATVTANLLLSASHTFEFERTALENATPVIGSMSAAAEGVEGRYPSRGPTLYEVRDGFATWGTVDDSTSEVEFHFVVHNPSSVPVPARPDGLRATVAMNGVEMIRTTGGEFSLEDLDRDALLAPGETREVVLAVEMDNGKADEWFASHVRNGERTDVRVNFRLVFEEPRTGTTVALPPGGITYECRVQTAILVDGRETSTTCGSGGGVSATPAATAPVAPATDPGPPVRNP